MAGREARQGRQVISITHLPQIAALGKHHFKIWKEDTQTHTLSHITCLSQEERVAEIANMLSGSNVSPEAICVAHHKDDQAETLVLNLIRGTGLKGLAAMHPDRIVNGLRIIRPLLDITKKEILQYLARMGQDYVTDSSNLERDALRNRIRLDLMPMLRQLNPNITDCLAHTAHNVRLELDSDSEESHYYRWLAPLGFMTIVFSRRTDTEDKSRMIPNRSLAS